MAAQADLVHETSTTTGTGNFTTAAVNGKQRFSDASAFGTGVTTNVFDYFISNRDVAGEWEHGTGHMSAAGTMVRDTVIASSNANALVSFTTGTKDVTSDVPASDQLRKSVPATTAAAGPVQLGVQVREVLTANRAYFVGSSSAIAISIASPGVVTWTAHGLVANQQVVLSFLPFRKSVTMTIASPGVVTWVAHGLAAGQPIVFDTTGALPTGATAGTTYFVIAAGLATDTFEFSATVGGSAVNTSGTQSGTHFGSKTGTLPTGLSVDTAYFVKTVLTVNTFTLSATPGGAVINTTGSQTGTINAITGSDSFTGLSGGTTAAFLTPQKAFDTILKTLDLDGYTATVLLADGTTLGSVSMPGPAIGGNGSAGSVVLQGNVTYPDNAFLKCTTASTDVISLLFGAVLNIGGVKFQATSTGNCLAVTYGAHLSYSLCVFSISALMVHPDFGGRILQSGNNWIVGAANAFLHATNFSFFKALAGTLYVSGNPNFPSFFMGESENSNVTFENLTINGVATTTGGSRYYIHQGATCVTSSNTFDAETYFPGSTVGIINGKGSYNDFFARIDTAVMASAPTTPGAGTSFVYIDPTTKRLSNKDDAGVVHRTVEAGAALLAWGFFSVSGGACTILSSFNVSSVSYSAAGQFVAHLTTAAAGTNSYGGTAMAQNGAGNPIALEDSGRTASAFPIVVVNRGTGATMDPSAVSFVLFGT